MRHQLSISKLLKHNSLNISLTCIFICLLTLSQAQEKYTSLTYQAYASSGNILPFWLTTNQNGIFAEKNNSYQILNFELERQFRGHKNNRWDFSYGIQLIASHSIKTRLIPIDYWAEGKYKNIILSIGAKSDAIRFGGLSSTNANLMWSNNARPLPHIGILSNNFIPIFSNNKKFLFRFLFEENFLFDKRYVNKTHLHHKNFFIRFEPNKKWKLTVGLDHWVFWGGESPEYDQLPTWENYFRYILAIKGNTKAPATDQNNVSGNQLGSHYLEITKEFRNQTLSFYWNHPFEDGSGLRFVNISDGLWGISLISKNKRNKLTGILLEFMRTMHQSGSYHQLEPDPQFPGRKDAYGKDNYFNHSIYKSGFTHFGKMMGSPFFIPYLNEDGISTGFKSTRMEVFHLGFKGAISSNLFWHTMASYSRNYGTYSIPYEIPIELYSYLLKLNYQKVDKPLQFNLYVAGDWGNTINHRLGIGIGAQYRFK